MNAHAEGDGIAYHIGHRRTLDAPAKAEDEDRIEYRRDDRQRQGDVHRPLRIADAAQDERAARRTADQDIAGCQRPDEQLRQTFRLAMCTKQVEQRTRTDGDGDGDDTREQHGKHQYTGGEFARPVRLSSTEIARHEGRRRNAGADAH